MNWTLRLAAVILAATALLAWWALREGEFPTDDPTRAGTATVNSTAGPSVAAPRVPATQGPRRPAAASATAVDPLAEEVEPASDPEPPPFGVTVRVLRADGTPVAGATVTTVVGSRSATEPTEKTTDAGGRAAFDDLEMSGSSALLAHARGREAALVPRPREPGEVVMRLGPATAIEGRVETTRGEPVEGATCYLRWPEECALDLADTLVRTESGADGRFRFPTLPDAPGGAVPTVLAWLRADGWADDEQPVRDGVVVLRLRAPRAALGRLVDAAGRPVAGVSVFVTGSRVVATDETGRFALTHIPAEGAPLAVVPDVHAPFLVALPAGADDVELGDVVLADGVPLTGVVVGTDGRPLPGVSVAATGHDPAEWDRSTKTGTDGRFTIQHLPPDETVRVVAWLAGSSGRAPADWRAADGEIRIVFPLARILRLRFVREDGVTPVEVPSCWVAAGRWYRTGAAAAPSSELVVAADPCERLDVKVTVPGWETVVVPGVTVTDEGPTTIDVRLTTPAKPEPHKPRPHR